MKAQRPLRCNPRKRITRAISTACESKGDSQPSANKILGLVCWEAAMSYSKDLRVRVIQAVEDGETARAAARHFVIGDSTAIRWAKRWRETGSVEARSVKGQSRSPLKA